MSPARRILCTLAAAFLVALFPLRGQDDMGASPPPPDTGDSFADSTDDSDAGGAPEGGATFQTFYDNLGSQGTWIQTDDYGYVWQPTVTDPDWAPYVDGHWVYTDDGWTWVSDEPWGWATYHYGRWVNLDGTGWCWVPGYTWAPAWVSWRYGEGYAGWAPLPPDSFVGIDYFGDGVADSYDFHIGGDCDSYYGIGAGYYCFIPVNCLGYRSYHRYYCNRHDNYAIINHTRNVTNLNVSHHGGHGPGSGGGFNQIRHVTTGGPSFTQVNSVAQVPVLRVSVVHSRQPGGGTVTNNALSIYAPRLHSSGASNIHPSTVTKTIPHANINRGIDVTRPLTVNGSLAPTPATPDQIQQARQAQANAPAPAKIATAGTTVKPVLQSPLGSLKTYSPPSNPGPSQGVIRTGAPRTYSPTMNTPSATPGTYQNNNGGSRPIYQSRPTYIAPAAGPATGSAPSASSPGVRPTTPASPPSANRTYTGSGSSQGGSHSSGSSGSGSGGGGSHQGSSPSSGTSSTGLSNKQNH